MYFVSVRLEWHLEVRQVIEDEISTEKSRVEKLRILKNNITFIGFLIQEALLLAFV
jgi:hypothetical protein